MKSWSRECGKNEVLEPQGSASLLVGQTYSIVSLKDLTENSTHNLRPGSPGIQVLQGPPGASSLSGVVEHCELYRAGREFRATIPGGGGRAGEPEGASATQRSCWLVH